MISCGCNSLSPCIGLWWGYNGQEKWIGIGNFCCFKQASPYRWARPNIMLVLLVLWQLKCWPTAISWVQVAKQGLGWFVHPCVSEQILSTNGHPDDSHCLPRRGRCPWCCCTPRDARNECQWVNNTWGYQRTNYREQNNDKHSHITQQWGNTGM